MRKLIGTSIEWCSIPVFLLATAIVDIGKVITKEEGAFDFVNTKHLIEVINKK